MEIVGLSFILILKVCLKVRRKSISNKRKFFFRPMSISVTKNKTLSKVVNSGGSPPSNTKRGLVVQSVGSSNTLLRKLFEDTAILFQRQKRGRPWGDSRLVLWELNTLGT